jgi:hypothetical protein
MKVIPLTPNFVAEIQEIQLDRITDSEFERLYAAWLVAVRGAAYSQSRPR